MHLRYEIFDPVLMFLVALRSRRSSSAAKALRGAKILAADLVLAVSLPSSIYAANPASDVPTGGFAGDHYSSLWTKSPFAIATPEAGAPTQDYQLTGLAQFDGVSYASLIDKQTQGHFLLTSAKPVRNLSLVSISHGRSGGSAVILRNGEQLILQEENASPVAGLPFIPGQQTVGIVPPGQNNPSVGIVVPLPEFPPRVKMHRPPIAVPPPAPQ